VSEINELKYNDLLSEIQDTDTLDISLRDKYIGLKQILERNCKELTRMESLQFPSLFSRLVFISQKYALSKSLEWQLQNIRVKASFLSNDENNIVSIKQYERAKEYLINFISIIYINNRIGEGSGSFEKPSHLNSIPEKLRVQVVNIDYEKEILICKVDLDEEQELTVRYNVHKINDVFNSTIKELWINAQLNLIDSKIEDKTGYVIPRCIVLEPDYLIDASALAECFQNYGSSHLHYFRKKFEPSVNSRHILLGNLANFFLDELVYADDPENIHFQETFFKAFKQAPFEYTSCNDIKSKPNFMEFMVKAKIQFENIKRVVISDFPTNDMITKQCTLEPSFFCEKYGFQGRLDLLQLPENDTDTYKIVELKSGGLPYPKEDASKIALNHETQTAIYRLIIQSVFGKQSRDVSSIILYSAAENLGENMRMAAPYQLLEKEIINNRNLIVSSEHNLYTGDKDAVENMFRQLFNLDNYGRTPQFFVDKIADIEKVIQNTTSLEKKYFFRYISFISRELYLQKMGDDNYESKTSTSSLWNTGFRERMDSYDLLDNLEILEVDDSGNDMKIKFGRPLSNNFVNFREGEICILYPHETVNDTVLTNQILKGTIAEISGKHVLVRFRYKQKNKQYLNKYKYWVIEHDRLDHAYNAMFKSLFAFLSAPINKRSTILGVEPPRSSNTVDDTQDHVLTSEEKQEMVINKAMLAQDYFFIVGPPGTGKTSIFARRLIELIYATPNNNLLIIAYTNRAVDELCEAINQAFNCNDASCDNYIRIGTELSCNELYRHRLLQNISKNVKSRDELRSIMYDKRIYVGTLAAITGKPELFDLKKFDVALIDEASQILEPQIVGLLPKFDKYVMIGDHKQLSTITLQDEYKSAVTDENLNNIELFDCSESYFERMFRICQKNGWTNVYEILTYQGRMHQEIADFPNKYFYNNELCPANEWQKESLSRNLIDYSNPYQKLITEKRQAFLSCRYFNNNVASDKINEGEAELVVSLSQAVIEVYKASNLNFDERKTLGIITPYRNQIALIKHKLEETTIPELQNIMVDTVERYQGSQRDIIILSFCINKPYQLDFFSNMNLEKTVDRKLNVALTRARQQLFLIGNDYILRQNYIYNKLIEETAIYQI